ncbi:Rha family transcriptional regulator [Paenibacillus larvae]|nr:Rha family transcriptional regulator [Paenibacillus larvae]MDT2277540.1 Rha family transcriptional regulator [Paenibacillus larvae]
MTVAEVFGKRHADVLRSIHNLECSDDFNERNFASVEVMTERANPERLSQTKTAFILGHELHGKAARFKEMYIAEFNRMRKQLISHHKRS